MFLFTQEPVKFSLWSISYYRLKSRGILENLTGNRIAQPVWIFVLPVVMDLAHRRVSVAQWLNIEGRNRTVWGLIPRADSKFFLCLMLVTRRKTNFSISLPSSKLTFFLISITNKFLLAIVPWKKCSESDNDDEALGSYDCSVVVLCFQTGFRVSRESKSFLICHPMLVRVSGPK